MSPFVCFNGHLMFHDSDNSDVYIWSAARQMAKHYLTKSNDPVHLLGTPALPIFVQMLLNLHCNQFIDDAAADKNICCKSPNV